MMRFAATLVVALTASVAVPAAASAAGDPAPVIGP